MTMKDKIQVSLLWNASGKVSTGTIVFLAVLGIFIFYVYFWWVEPRYDAANFEDTLEEYGARKFHISRDYSAVEEGEVPYRIGKVLVVIPEHKIYMKREGEIIPPKIHPIWYKLNRGMRASNPEEVNTLIRISRDLKGARRYQRIGGVESKVISAHVVQIDVYDMDDASFIGRWTLDPGWFEDDVMQEEDLDDMIEATSDDTILKFVKSMPEA